jgi:conjugative relaxase-like TrwC/TraI family protein
MLTGVNPATGEPLGLQHVAGKGPVPGFDLTFGAPMSVSLTWALGSQGVAAEVKAAHASAVQAGLDYLQGAACWTRRGRGGREFLKGNGFLATGYVHRSSRAGDPHLHTHVLVANATYADGRWTRLYHPALYEHAKTASAIYEAHLRDELTRRLGVRFKEVRNGIAEIAGFDPGHLRHFSKRWQEILEAAGPGASAEAMQVATLATRPKKTPEIEGEALREHWRREADEIGLNREAVRSTFGREVEPFDGRVAVADPVRIAESPKGDRFTTRAIWDLEQKALGTVAEMGQRADRAVVSEIVLGRVLSERPSLKPDQRAMVERLLGGGEGVVVVIGEAGTGKTYALTAAARGWSAAGGELRAAAPTWRAANVLRAEGLEATSVARLLAQLEHAARSGDGGLSRGSVLVVDEAGMVDSRNLARLIAHARQAEAKLVLIGDPAQLGEIEAGGLFGAVASRSEPVILSEVIRHRHEAEREGARLIREGEGREALALFQGAERVTVALNAEARREAIVRDWWQSFRRGEDALMIAKTNREVAALNARARDEMKAAGRLGAKEIEAAGQRFAVGDRIVTRINDQRHQIYNRERWHVAEIEAGSGRMWLVGIDTRGRVCVDSDYLGRVRQRDGGPAIEHAYAATTYQAQGATVDRAFVVADPSMDRQEVYVAVSRSREETYIYATPEVQRFDRDEFAPQDPFLRDGLEHIAEAAQRDGSQVAAFDMALRERFEQMPTGQLGEVVRELRAEAGAEAQNDRRSTGIEERMAEEARGLEEARSRLGEEPRFETREWATRERIDRLRAEWAELPEVSHDARAELAAARSVLSQREQAAVAAARISPPDYVTAELGKRPRDPAKAAQWDKAVRGIESYRVRNGVKDKNRALGPKQKEPARRQEQRRAREGIERAQRRLQRQRQRSAQRAVERGIGR